jgi:hypothetical protein
VSTVSTVDVSAADRQTLARNITRRIAGLGATAQAAIPGLYAWGVTVVPAAWSRGAPWLSQLAALLGLFALGIAPLIERWSSNGARIVSVWGLVTTSGLVWVLAPASLAPGKLDALWAVAGMVGWGLFALATAAPALQRMEPVVSPVGLPLRPRATLPRGDLAYLTLGVLLAAGLQVVGWRAMAAERALLVRMVALLQGLAVIGAATAAAISRHTRRPPASSRRRLRRALLWIVLFGLMAVGAAFLLLR